MTALEHCSGSRPSSLCGQCHTALASLVSVCQEMESGVSCRIALPYFGVVSIGSKPNASNHGGGRERSNSLVDRSISGYEPSAPAQHTNMDVLDRPFPVDDIFWDCHGPLVINYTLQPSLAMGNQENGDLGIDRGGYSCHLIGRIFHKADLSYNFRHPSYTSQSM